MILSGNCGSYCLLIWGIFNPLAQFANMLAQLSILLAQLANPIAQLADLLVQFMIHA